MKRISHAVSYLFLFLCFWGGATAAMAQVPTTLTLEDVLKRVERNNLEIQVAKRMWEEEKAKVGVATAWFQPEVGVEFGGKDYWDYFAVQTFPTPAKVTLAGSAQEHRAKSEWGHYQAKRNEIAQQAKQAYFDYLYTYQKEEVLKESAALLSQLVRVATGRVAAGKSSPGDVLKGEIEYAKALNELPIIQAEKEARRATLNALLGESPGASLGKPLLPASGSLSLNYATLVEMAMAYRPELHATHHHIDHMQAELDLARAGYFPDTMLQLTRRNFSNGMEGENMVMVKLNLPFLWGTKQGPLVRQMEIAKAARQSEHEALVLKTQEEVKMLLATFTSTRHLVELYRTTVIPQAKQSISLTLAGYGAGKTDFLDLLESERRWLDFRMEYLGYFNAYWKTIADLERVVGTPLKED